MNLAENLERSSRFHARAVATSSGDEVVTYRELGRQSREVAGFLTERGIGPGDHVVLLVPNVLEFAPLYYGILHAGAVVVPLDPQLTADQFARRLADAAPRLAFVWHTALSTSLEADDPHTDGPHSDSPGTSGTDIVVIAPGSLTALDGAGAAAELAPRAPSDLAAVVYTSGASGRPKGVRLTHGALLRSADIVVQDLFELSAGDVVLAALPLFQSFGQTAALHAAIRAGASLALLDSLDAVDVLSAVRRRRVTALPAVPPMIGGILDLLDQPSPAPLDVVDVSSLRVCLSGGAPLAVETLLSFERTADCVVLEGYVLSEAPPMATCNRIDRRRVGSVGIPLPGLDLRIVDERGREVGDSEPGEIAVRGDIVTTGYTAGSAPDDPTADADLARAGPDDWLRTGDIGRRDEDGFVYLVDRTSDLIVHDGHTIYPREIEEALREHPAVRDAAVLDRSPDIVALATLRPGAAVGRDELRTYLAAALPSHQHPTSVRTVETLPTNAAGTILKRRIALDPDP
ncbi:hypothetical protein BJF85_03905 [Saccharomonospora sp. CUA-673]|uniref:AMP-binding protein n=1 Tax=Saccharomonospora sp. CUA-673 TaxID=1904969 RepID=UPI0009695069|nr:AMP-binding protein [Saccharomonospora sp. CUA-673]OLT43189.1 hypothetical protein BJF85_03905 [Saccharomonospora sp. CUA-673]